MAKEYTEFVQLLEKYLEEKDRSASWLARQLEIQPSTVAKWRSDNQRPGNPEKVKKIASALQLNTQQREELFRAAKYSDFLYSSLSTPEQDNESEKIIVEPNHLQKGLLGWPKNDVLRQNYKPFLSFHEKLIRELCARLSETNNTPRIFVLYGPHGMGKSKIAHMVATRVVALNRPGVAVIFHLVDHVAESEDASDALNPFIERISNCLGIPTTESIAEQQEKIRNSIQKYNYKLELVLDGLRDGVESVFIDFLESLPDSVRALITHNSPVKCGHRQQEYDTYPLPRIAKEDTYSFLKACWQGIQISVDDIERIDAKIGGNSFALWQIAKALRDNLNGTLDDILGAITVSGDVAYQLVGKTYSSLSTEVQALLNTHSLFRDTADWRSLATIAGFELIEPTQQSEVVRNIEELCRLEILSHTEKPERFRMEEPYRTYVREVIEQSTDERKKWKNRWIEYYKSLRPRKPKFHDSVGWTSFADYFPDGLDQVNYADEIETIIDVVKYCISQKHIEEYWHIAVEVLYNFRTTLFATGKWDIRIELCKQVLQEAERREHNQIVGQLKRMLAWIYCFKDDYEVSEEFTKSAREIAYNGIQNKDIEVAERIIHRQTYYKSLNTLGNIVLRRGYNATICGQIIVRHLKIIEKGPALDSLKKQAQQYFQKASDWFEEARDWFLRSDGFVGAEFPDETLIANFYIAQVGYYNRHFYGIPIEKEKEYIFERLDKSRKSFLELLKIANKREHERLITHIHYYLGKIYRRLARHFEGDFKEKYFAESFAHFEEALDKAKKYGDFVLVARIKFACGQWYEDKSILTLVEADKNSYLGEARELVKEASIDLAKLGMIIESIDAVAFLKQRLDSIDIPNEFLLAYENRYREIIIH